MKNFAIIIFLFLASRVEAQYTSVPTPTIPPQSFTVLEKRGCAPFTVRPQTTFNCGAPGISCSARKGDGTPAFLFVENQPILYSTAGNFTLEIIFGATGTSALDIQVYPNIKPTFDIYSCVGSKVSVEIPDTNYDEYIIEYDDGVSVKVPRGSSAKDTHLLPSGPSVVQVHGHNMASEDNCIPAASQTIDVTQTLTPAFISKLEVLSASQIKLDYNTAPVSNELNTQYQLYIVKNYNGSTGFQKAQSISKTITSTITVPNTEANFFCFKMNAIDACTNTEVNPADYSNTICSASFDLEVQSDLMKPKWVTHSSAGSNVSDFSIDKTPGTPLSALSSDTFVDDIDIICNTEYTYQLTTNYSNGSRSISLPKRDRSFSNVIPAAIEDISIVVSQTGAALSWFQDPVTEYTIYKSNSGSYSALANTTTSSYSDATYVTASGSCYKISYVDACLNSSPLSAEACPIQLSGALQPNNDIHLSWSGYTGWKNDVNNYVIQKFNSQGQLIETIQNGSTTTYPDLKVDSNQTYVYVVTAVANDGGVSESVSNTLRITKEPYLTYPTAFSPRGSEPKNQIFKVFGQYVSSFELRIFNRWGQEMFYTNNFEIGWDGTYNGSLMPEGTYVFSAQITDQEGKTSDRSGTVVLLVK